MMTQPSPKKQQTFEQILISKILDDCDKNNDQELKDAIKSGTRFSRLIRIFSELMSPLFNQSYSVKSVKYENNILYITTNSGQQLTFSDIDMNQFRK